MILQALNDYYERSDVLAPAGWERKRIPYLIELRQDGQFVQLVSLRAGPRPSDIPTSLVPVSENRQGKKAYEKPNLLWDHIGHVFGQPKSDLPSEVQLAARQLDHFQKRIDWLAKRLPDNHSVRAVRLFYASGEFRRVTADPHWNDCLAVKGCNFTFRLAGATELLVHDAAIRELISTAASAATEDADQQRFEAMCLVTGKTGRIERKHPPIAGVGKKPAPLSAVNDGRRPAYASHGKHQGENFPVGQDAAFKYSTALNHLLRLNSPQKMMVGDASTVFWAQRADVFEDELSQLLGANVDDPVAHTEQVKALFESIRSGAFDGARGDNRFFVLGLAPNAARISVRFWHAGPLRELALRVRQWFDDLAIARPSYERDEYPALKTLLRAVVLQRKDENIPPGLAGDVLRAIFTGTPYPALWLNLAVRRCRAEQEVSYHRAAVIKACLRRSGPAFSSTEEAISTMLDPSNTQPPYRLGRLFAVLEKIQEESAGGALNKTIRDRYYGAASSTPGSVVPLLLKLKNHHVGKLDDRGQRMLYRAFQDHRPDDYIGAILAGVDDIPAHLTLPEQGRFALGYYHQRQAFFTKADAATDHTTDNPEGTR